MVVSECMTGGVPQSCPWVSTQCVPGVCPGSLGVAPVPGIMVWVAPGDEVMVCITDQ